jgi:hypothetical protein
MKRRKKEHPNAQGLTEDWRDNDPTVYEERWVFLKAASDHKSIRLGDSLHDNVWRKIQEEQEKYLKSGEETEKLMWDWAASFNLAVVWAISMFFSAISIGSFPKKTVRFDLVVIYSPPPRFQFPVWNMQEDEAKYRGRVNQMFASILDEYIADSKKKRSSYSTQRRRSGPVEMRYAWAALRVCRGWTFDQIAEKYRVAPQSVSEMVTKICDRIGLSG